MRTSLASLSGVGILAAAALAATPTLAQEADAFTWDPNRPDAHALFGVTGDRVLATGEVVFTYRYGFENSDGVRLGEFELTFDEVLDVFQSTPLTMDRQVHQVDLEYGLRDEVTLFASVPWVVNGMDQLTRTDLIISSEASSIGDLRVGAIYSVFAEGPYRAHVNLGVSIPTGSIDETGLNPASAPGESRLPYAMQTGSGTFDVLPGLTVLAMNEHGVVGVQGAGTLRIGENDSDYALGSRFQANGWFGIPVGDQLSLSAGLRYQRWDPISGEDPALAGAAAGLVDPTFFPQLSGGTRLDLPFGLNLHLLQGPLAGNRFSVEVVVPLAQDLDGPQLQNNWGITVGWRSTLQ